MEYDKIKAMNIIITAARIYENTLRDKELMVITKQRKKMVYYEMQFRSRNFKHFTGVDSKLSANRFYNMAINRKLSVKDIGFKDAFLAEKKMRILQNAMNLPYSARMVGEFDYSGIKIQADFGSGNTNYTMVFRKDKNNHLYPVSILEEDIRKSTRAASPVVAILTRNIGDKAYNNITYQSTNINIDNLTIPKDLRNIISNAALQQLKPSNIEKSNQYTISQIYFFEEENSIMVHLNEKKWNYRNKICIEIICKNENWKFRYLGFGNIEGELVVKLFLLNGDLEKLKKCYSEEACLMLVYEKGE